MNLADFHFLASVAAPRTRAGGAAVVGRAGRRRDDARQMWKGIIRGTPAAAPAERGRSGRARFGPLELIATEGWLVAVLAVAGPAWRGGRRRRLPTTPPPSRSL